MRYVEYSWYSYMYHIIKSSDCSTWSTIGVSDSYWFNFGMYYIPSLTGAKYFDLRCGPDGDYECYLDQSSDGVTFTKVNLSSYFTQGRPIVDIYYINSVLFVSQGYYTNVYTIYSLNQGSIWTKLDNISSNKYCLFFVLHIVVH